MCNDVMIIRRVIRTRGSKKDNVLIADLFSVSDHVSFEHYYSKVKSKFQSYLTYDSDMNSSFNTRTSPHVCCINCHNI